MEGARSTTPPFAATLLTWFLPGAGQAMAGAWRAAVLGFVLVEGLYLVGFLLSDGLVFEFLSWELRGRFALVLTPEVGNLGALVAHQMAQPLGAPNTAPPVPPSTVHLGAALTAASGVLNLVLMCHAHLVARVGASEQANRTAVQVAAGWAVPGLGHWLQGRRARAVVVGGVLVTLFAVGTWMCAGTNLSREHHFYYWSGQALLGLPAFAAEALRGHPDLARVPGMLDVGIFYACLAGLLNGLVLIDVFAWGESRALGLDPVEDRRDLARHRREAKTKDGRDARRGTRSEGGAKGGPASKHLVAPRPTGAGSGAGGERGGER